MAWKALFTNLTKSMRRPCAEREGTHEPRLVNANGVRVDVRTLPAASAERKEMLMCEKSRSSVVES